jgi:anti-anti-sigma factor
VITPVLGTLEVEQHDDVAVVRLLGEHDISTSDLLGSELHRHVGEGIVVSLTETEFLDSSVVHELYAAHERLRKQNRQLVLHVATASIVRRVLELSGLSTELPCTGSLEQAVEFARRR